MSVFSERLKSLREDKHYNKTQIAKLIGVPLSTYANWEYGYNEPDMERLGKISTILNTSIEYLIGKSDNQYLSNDDEIDLAKYIDNARAFDGEPITESDKKIAKALLQSYFNNKE